MEVAEHSWFSAGYVQQVASGFGEVLQVCGILLSHQLIVVVVRREYEENGLTALAGR